MADEKQEVVVTDIKVHFSSMVLLMVEWAIASIPAVVILYAAAVVLAMAFDSLAVLWSHWWGARPS